MEPGGTDLRPPQLRVPFGPTVVPSLVRWKCLISESSSAGSAVWPQALGKSAQAMGDGHYDLSTPRRNLSRHV